MQLLLASNDVRAMGRMARGVAAVAELDRVRLETHRSTWPPNSAALADLNTQRTALAALQKDAARAKAAVDTAVNARNRLIDDLDRRRDLAAQYVAELQQAQRDLERTVATTDAASTVMALPIRPFRGDLPWPMRGEVDRAFRARRRPAVSAPRSSEMVSRSRRRKAPRCAAVHEGTVAYAAPFTGFGTLVIVDHGRSAFTLYGHLSEAVVSAGTNVSRGTALGHARPVAVRRSRPLLRVRIDGRPVDPLQWLRRSSMKIRGRVLVLAVSMAVIAFAVIGGFMSKAIAREDSYQYLRIFEDVVSLILNNYVEDVNVDKVMHGAMHGLADGLDPDSAYLDVNQVKVLDEGRSRRPRRKPASSSPDSITCA